MFSDMDAHRGKSVCAPDRNSLRAAKSIMVVWYQTDLGHSPG